MTPRTVALVESATQLLNAAEWAYAAGEIDDVTMVVLAPTDPHSIRQLRGVTDLLTGSGFRIEKHAVRAKHPALPARTARALSRVRHARRLVIGDPFSRWIHTALPFSKCEHAIVVDDGTATWDYADSIDRGEPLTRWSVGGATARPHAVRATRLLTPSVHRSIDVFSCLRDATPAGATALINRYCWTRSRWRPEVVPGQLDLLGSSLVDNGIVARRPYVDAVAARARSGRTVRYLAHRRESENLVAEIATIPNLQVVRPVQPVEILLRTGPVAERVAAFPSTAAHTLPVILDDVGVDVEVLPIEPDWFTAEATDRARSFVFRIVAEAMMRPAPREAMMRPAPRRATLRPASRRATLSAPER